MRMRCNRPGNFRFGFIALVLIEISFGESCMQGGGLCRTDQKGLFVDLNGVLHFACIQGGIGICQMGFREASRLIEGTRHRVRGNAG